MYYDYIQISKINDFIFCPYSLYFHAVYENVDGTVYKSFYQVAGKLAHTSIDDNKYSTKKDILQNFEVYSEEFGLIGKIDIYDKKKKILIERKRRIKKVYDGHIYQILAQKICLEEMDYKVEKMFIYSLDDKKKYEVKINKIIYENFINLIKKIRNFNFTDIKFRNENKCSMCIYRELCNNGDIICNKIDYDNAK